MIRPWGGSFAATEVSALQAPRLHRTHRDRLALPEDDGVPEPTTGGKAVGDCRRRVAREIMQVRRGKGPKRDDQQGLTIPSRPPRGGKGTDASIEQTLRLQNKGRLVLDTRVGRGASP